jgi:hypothetical protein
MKRALGLILMAAAMCVAAKAQTRKTTQVLTLGESRVNVNVYEKDGARVTLFAPHYNEQAAIRTAKDIIEARGGRLIEIESFDVNGKPSRHVRFFLNGKNFTLDPNRIFTPNGRRCGGFTDEAETAVGKFADALSRVVFAEDGKRLREGEPFVVAVHNNTDFETRANASATRDLTAPSFLRAQTADAAHGIFSEQADGVFLSNTEYDADNFVFLSSPTHIGFFAAQGFNVVVQTAIARVASTRCTLDDGSLSIYAAQNGAEYICLEADARNGAFRQRQMLESVYKLAQTQKPSEKPALAEEK